MVALKSYGDMWQDITDWLKAHATEIGLAEENIYQGHPLIGESLPTPYVAVFALPAGDDASEFDSDSIGIINYTIFVASIPDNNIVSSVINSTELAGSARNLLATQYPYVYRHTKPQAETMFNNACIMSFELLSPYRV